jgi:hypothetical protein
MNINGYYMVYPKFLWPVKTEDRFFFPPIDPSRGDGINIGFSKYEDPEVVERFYNSGYNPVYRYYQ